ncbi:Molybdenum cofactor biosynthesis protein 1 [Eumeta japonica]|uniref:cyclic pyranopterin monophosphate synthase n=1 Tax=Eumeta variegata TaxID=151549 RepID=A0A4C1YZT6_EUMVA|nr:Molybdenum cofactor biosynthesis protein 1 [Eumeta japonica]
MPTLDENQVRSREKLPKLINRKDVNFTMITLDHTHFATQQILKEFGFNDDEIGDFVALTRDRNVEVRFIEFMPFSGNAWETNQLVGWRTALTAAAAAVPAPGLQPLPGSPHDTAKRWAVPGWAGAVGFISSMTEHFCTGCNRLRLMADGSLKVCLFGASEISLRDALRAGACDDEIAALIRAALRNKKPSHAGNNMLHPIVHAESRANAKPTNDTDRRLTASTQPSSGAAAVAAAMAVTAVPWQLRQQRAYCNDARLSHLDDQGRARMVDVGAKAVTRRVAVAVCSVRVAAPVLRLLRAAGLPKGDALTVAEIAGVMGAKRTADLIPLCHPLPLDCVRVSVHLPTDSIGALRVQCEVCVRAPTGAEMEALTGAAVAALALYDMCKSADKNIVISDLRLLHKSGGRSDINLQSLSPATSTPVTSPSDDCAETYAPTGFPHL